MVETLVPRRWYAHHDEPSPADLPALRRPDVRDRWLEGGRLPPLRLQGRLLL